MNLSTSQKADIVRRAVDGEVLTKLADDFGVTRQAIRGILRRRGVPARATGKLTEAQRSQAVRRYVEGATMAQVAAMCGVTEPSVS